MGRRKNDISHLKPEIGKQLSLSKVEYRNRGDEVLMPFVVAASKGKLSAVQLNVIVALLKKLISKFRSILSGEVEEGQQLQLFAEEELTDDGTIKFMLLYKDMGVSTNHYEDLSAALSLLPFVPIEMPYKSPSGRVYKRYTSFIYEVYIPENPGYRKYCIVTIKPDVAKHVLSKELGIGKIDEKISVGLENKYSKKIYWLLQTHKKLPKWSCNFNEFKQIIDAEDKYITSIKKFQKNILDKAIDDIKDLYIHGKIDCYLSYILKLSDRRESSTITFIIHKSSDSKTETDRQLDVSFQESKTLFKNILIDDLNMPINLAVNYEQRINSRNVQHAISKAIELKEIINSSKDIRITLKYLITSFNRFFESRGWEKQETKVPKEHEESSASPKNTSIPNVNKYVQPSSLPLEVRTGENRDLWGQLLREYDGPLKDKLKETTFIGMHPGGFKISMSKELSDYLDKDKKEFDKIKKIARRLLSLTPSHPAIIKTSQTAPL